MEAGSSEEGAALRELAHMLRSGAGEALREEAAIAELETLLWRLRRRTLADVAREAMHRGDLLTLAVSGRSVTGLPRFVGEDYVVVSNPHLLADVRLDRVVLSVTRRREGGHTTTGGSATFRARLAEYEQTGETVRVAVAGAADDVVGRISVVAADHLVVADGDREVVVPLAAVTMVLRPAPGASN